MMNPLREWRYGADVLSGRGPAPVAERIIAVCGWQGDDTRVVSGAAPGQLQLFNMTSVVWLGIEAWYPFERVALCAGRIGEQIGAWLDGPVDATDDAQLLAAVEQLLERLDTPAPVSAWAAERYGLPRESAG